MKCDRIWRNARLATMVMHKDDPIGVVEAGIVAVRDGIIVYAGAATDAPALDAADIIDCEGRWVLPGLVDCHTHLIHAGDRAQEFEQRLAGVSYEAIAHAGGGIASTVTATRLATEEMLVASALPRLDALLAEGVTTVEIKSGYGLTLDHEAKMLRAARRLGGLRQVGVRTTFLGAHALPLEWRDDPDGYITLVADRMIPAIATAGLADAVDAFCEGIGFSPEQVARVFDAAAAANLPVKLHAEQLSNLEGAALAASYGALSADHLEHAGPAAIAAMAAAGTVAVLLPGAFYFTREERRPPVARLRAAGVPMAIATDCNPGTSPLTSPLLAMNMAATFFRMTVPECLAGVTREGARALGLLDRIGTLETGKQCDLSIWSVGRPAELVYRIGANPLHSRIVKGRHVR